MAALSETPHLSARVLLATAVHQVRAAAGSNDVLSVLSTTVSKIFCCFELLKRQENQHDDVVRSNFFRCRIEDVRYFPFSFDLNSIFAHCRCFTRQTM